ncbi:hypothetical protein ACQUY5_31495 [Bacillus cereus]|uniref:hypothetical protein n=1 Tax=Bacillus cereus TaxID=1396 RepID=UPI003D176A3F
MKQTKLFNTMSKPKENGVEGYDDINIDTQINEFLANNNVELISVSLSTKVDEDGSNYDCALVTYDNKVTQLTKEELVEARKDNEVKHLSLSEMFQERLSDMQELSSGEKLNIPLLWAKHGTWIVNNIQNQLELTRCIEEKKNKVL